jgi:hypothetical protein
MRQFSRYKIISIAGLLYAFPFLVILLAGKWFLDSWKIVNLGIAAVAAAILSLFWILLQWEKGWTNYVKEGSTTSEESLMQASLALNEIQDLKKRLEECAKEISLHQKEKSEFAEKSEEHFKELEMWKNQWKSLQEERDQLACNFEEYKEQTLAKIEERNGFLEELQNVIADLRASLEHKQQQNVFLDTKVRDLNYEIKTLLKIAETPLEPLAAIDPIKHRTSSYGAAAPVPEDGPKSQLKRCLEIAHEIIPNYGFAKSKERPIESFALEQRHLFDRLRDESICPVLVFAPKEHKVLFVSEQIRQLLGLPPEKFIQTFPDLIQVGMQEWKQAINQLSFKNEALAAFPLKGKGGQEIHVECHLGLIQTGMFRNHVIGVLAQN